MGKKKAEDIYKGFNKLNILIIGDVMVDSYLWGSVDRISPEAPVPVVNVRKREKRLGGAGNVIMNVKALGCTPLICAVIGDDEDGKVFLNILKENKLSNSGILVTKAKPTTVKHRIIGGSQHILRVDSEDDKPLSPEDRKKLLGKIQKLISKADVVLFQDYDKGVISKELIGQVVKWCNQKGIPSVVDPKKRNFLNYSGTTFFKPNLKEIKEGLQLDINPESKRDLDHASAMLNKKLSNIYTLITLSERGVYINGMGESKVIPAHKREIADVSGAGDTVISIAAACLGLGLNQVITAALSNLGGGIVCEQVGVVPIDKDKLFNEAKRLKLL